MLSKFKYFSKFAGIGGFEQGITKIYPEAECVGYSEINKYSAAVYNYHFPNHKNYGDITKINFAELPDFDLLTGGVPCQAWSIAGKQKGFDDPRGKMWFYFIELLKVKRPKMFIAENVKGLVMGENKTAFKFLISEFCKLGYAVDFHLFNSKDYGVPQNRERIYIIGILQENISDEFRLDKNRTIADSELFLFPKTKFEKYASIERSFREQSGRKILLVGKDEEDVNERKNDKPQTNICTTITTRFGQRADNTFVLKELTKGQSQGARIYDAEGLAVTQSSAGGGLGAKTGLYKISEGQVRKLTPVECERLQGFPDNYTKYGLFGSEVKEVSDTQRYFTLGNAVTVNVVEAIFEQVKNCKIIKQ